MDELKIILALALLVYASILDWRHREINDRSWMSLVALGVLFLFFNPGELKSLVASVAVASLLVAITYIPGFVGGGDAKVLLGLAVLFPHSPVYGTPFFVPGVFFNAVTISLPLPFYFFFRNLLREKGLRRDEFIKMFLGYKVRADKVKDYEAIMGKGVFMDVRKTKLGERGDPGETVWVTPAVPFIIPLTVGFVIAALYGDPFNYLAGYR
jgi:preflagellin peptidase FlaK